MPTINLGKKREYKRQYKSKADNLNHIAVYNTQRWQRLRLNYLMQNPLCAKCLETGIYTAAIDVHHITPISTGDTLEAKQKLGFNPQNLMSLCEPCHIEIHQKRGEIIW